MDGRATKRRSQVKGTKVAPLPSSGCKTSPGADNPLPTGPTQPSHVQHARVAPLQPSRYEGLAGPSALPPAPAVPNQPLQVQGPSATPLMPDICEDIVRRHSSWPLSVGPTQPAQLDVPFTPLQLQRNPDISPGIRQLLRTGPTELTPGQGPQVTPFQSGMYGGIRHSSYMPLSLEPMRTISGFAAPAYRPPSTTLPQAWNQFRLNTPSPVRHYFHERPYIPDAENTAAPNRTKPFGSTPLLGPYQDTDFQTFNSYDDTAVNIGRRPYGCGFNPAYLGGGDCCSQYMTYSIPTPRISPSSYSGIFTSASMTPMVPTVRMAPPHYDSLSYHALDTVGFQKDDSPEPMNVINIEPIEDTDIKPLASPNKATHTGMLHNVSEKRSIPTSQGYMPSVPYKPQNLNPSLNFSEKQSFVTSLNSPRGCGLSGVPVVRLHPPPRLNSNPPAVTSVHSGRRGNRRTHPLIEYRLSGPGYDRSRMNMTSPTSGNIDFSITVPNTKAVSVPTGPRIAYTNSESEVASLGTNPRRTKPMNKISNCSSTYVTRAQTKVTTSVRSRTSVSNRNTAQAVEEDPKSMPRAWNGTVMLLTVDKHKRVVNTRLIKKHAISSNPSRNKVQESYVLSPRKTQNCTKEPVDAVVSQQSSGASGEVSCPTSVRSSTSPLKASGLDSVRTSTSSTCQMAPCKEVSKQVSPEAFNITAVAVATACNSSMTEDQLEHHSGHQTTVGSEREAQRSPMVSSRDTRLQSSIPSERETNEIVDAIVQHINEIMAMEQQPWRPRNLDETSVCPDDVIVLSESDDEQTDKDDVAIKNPRSGNSECNPLDAVCEKTHLTETRNNCASRRNLANKQGNQDAPLNADASDIPACHKEKPIDGQDTMTHRREISAAPAVSTSSTPQKHSARLDEHCRTHASQSDNICRSSNAIISSVVGGKDTTTNILSERPPYLNQQINLTERESVSSGTELRNFVNTLLRKHLNSGVNAPAGHDVRLENQQNKSVDKNSDGADHIINETPRSPSIDFNDNGSETTFSLSDAELDNILNAEEQNHQAKGAKELNAPNRDEKAGGSKGDPKSCGMYDSCKSTSIGKIQGIDDNKNVSRKCNKDHLQYPTQQMKDRCKKLNAPQALVQKSSGVQGRPKPLCTPSTNMNTFEKKPQSNIHGQDQISTESASGSSHYGVPRRGRGRPRKEKENKISAASTFEKKPQSNIHGQDQISTKSASGSSQYCVSRRGRGRPRKEKENKISAASGLNGVTKANPKGNRKRASDEHCKSNDKTTKRQTKKSKRTEEDTPISSRANSHMDLPEEPSTPFVSKSVDAPNLPRQEGVLDVCSVNQLDLMKVVNAVSVRPADISAAKPHNLHSSKTITEKKITGTPLGTSRNSSSKVNSPFPSSKPNHTPKRRSCATTNLKAHFVSSGTNTPRTKAMLNKISNYYSADITSRGAGVPLPAIKGKQSPKNSSMQTVAKGTDTDSPATTGTATFVSANNHVQVVNTEEIDKQNLAEVAKDKPVALSSKHPSQESCPLPSSAKQDSRVDVITEVNKGQESKVEDITAIHEGQESKVSDLTESHRGQKAKVTMVHERQESKLDGITEVHGGQKSEVKVISEGLEGQISKVDDITEGLEGHKSKVDDTAEGHGGQESNVDGIVKISYSIEDQNQVSTTGAPEDALNSKGNLMASTDCNGGLTSSVVTQDDTVNELPPAMTRHVSAELRKGEGEGELSAAEAVKYLTETKFKCTITYCKESDMSVLDEAQQIQKPTKIQDKLSPAFMSERCINTLDNKSQCLKSDLNVSEQLNTNDVSPSPVEHTSMNIPKGQLKYDRNRNIAMPSVGDDPSNPIAQKELSSKESVLSPAELVDHAYSAQNKATGDPLSSKCKPIPGKHPANPPTDIPPDTKYTCLLENHDTQNPSNINEKHLSLNMTATESLVTMEGMADGHVTAGTTCNKTPTDSSVISVNDKPHEHHPTGGVPDDVQNVTKRKMSVKHQEGAKRKHMSTSDGTKSNVILSSNDNKQQQQMAQTKVDRLPDPMDISLEDDKLKSIPFVKLHRLAKRYCCEYCGSWESWRLQSYFSHLRAQHKTRKAVVWDNFLVLPQPHLFLCNRHRCGFTSTSEEAYLDHTCWNWTPGLTARDYSETCL